MMALNLVEMKDLAMDSKLGALKVERKVGWKAESLEH